MDKKGLAVRAVCFSVMLFCASANSVYAAKKEALVSPEEILAQQAKEAQSKARESLKRKEWIIYVSPAAGQPGATETDVLTFGEDNTVSSKNLSESGFGASNYSVTAESGASGLVVWETMKTAANNDVAFLRGELRGGAMMGTIFIKLQKGQNKTYNFSTVKPGEETLTAAPKKKSGK